MLVQATAASQGDWVRSRWSMEFDGRLVPSGFDACARIFHPARLDGRAVSWREIAAAFGTVAHARMEFEPLARRAAWDSSPAPGVFDRPPSCEWLPTELVAPAVDVLRRHTATPDRCRYGFWVGHAGLPDGWRSAPELTVPGRTYLLFTGSLDDAIASRTRPAGTAIGGRRSGGRRTAPGSSARTPTCPRRTSPARRRSSATSSRAISRSRRSHRRPTSRIAATTSTAAGSRRPARRRAELDGRRPRSSRAGRPADPPRNDHEALSCPAVGRQLGARPQNARQCRS